VRYRLLRYSLLVGATISAMSLGACGSEDGEGTVTVKEKVVETVPAGVKTVVTTPKAVETVTPPQQVTVVETETVVETVTK
jgi:hypothetical protein